MTNQIESLAATEWEAAPKVSVPCDRAVYTQQRTVGICGETPTAVLTGRTRGTRGKVTHRCLTTPSGPLTCIALPRRKSDMSETVREIIAVAGRV